MINMSRPAGHIVPTEGVPLDRPHNVWALYSFGTSVSLAYTAIVSIVIIYLYGMPYCRDQANRCFCGGTVLQGDVPRSLYTDTVSSGGLYSVPYTSIIFHGDKVFYIRESVYLDTHIGHFFYNFRFSTCVVCVT